MLKTSENRDTQQGSARKCLPTRRSATASAYLLGVYRTFPGSVVLVVHVAGGSTSSEEITVSHPPTYGDRLSTTVIVEERRNGPRTTRIPDLT